MSRPTEPAPFEPSPRPATREAERRIDEGAGREELARRLRQQAVVSDFGGLALEARDLDALLQQACALCAEGLGARFAKVLEWRPAEKRFLVRAGVGWRPGVVGSATLGADLESPAGFAFHTGKPVISNHLSEETRFRTPELLREHGVKRAINVLIRVGETSPYGVLEADSPDPGAFEEADVAFLQGLANLLGGALERARVEAELAETQERLHAALDAAEMGALDFDPRSGELHLDERCMRLLGLPPDAEMSFERLLQRVGPDDQAAIRKAVAQCLDPNGTGEFYVEIQVPSPQDRDVHYIAARGRVLIRPRRAARVVGIAFDVTYRRRAEDLMREALEHKDMLVREVSHRVKNSLQLVAGVLALQARGAQHEEVRQALTVAQTRLQTIGQIHDQLWRQPDVQEVELAAFLRSLCEKLQESAPGHVLSFSGPPISMTTDRAVPVALLVNELVTNAVKYAYPNGGPVEVLLSADGERLTLEVADRGVGLPPDLDLSEPRESLGMRVVSGLVRQLGAEFEARDNAPGARFVLKFDRVEPAGEAIAGV
ncbi:sensor histidine kinase [Caulobacter sp. 17J80-11]|uniref:sensor histidine kinase n=1 Tax=Caulobacter sp. 17J80-11 TaxID=2763502 RepID=UPI0016538537|nr:histidine kinase dimerization/phosphoacceptor domain -containing protein [Caulobacter sp. 17J80-11]MBC6981304.1 GAF domain-containing protein [Caulobacter sp. 17J80-11]